MEPNFVKVVSSSRKKIGITQSVIELKLPTNEDVITSIYSVSANSTILGSEIVGRNLEFTGIVDFQGVYDSAGISAIDYTAEFKDKFELPQEIVGEIIISSNVVDVTSNIVSGGIKVVAIVEVCVDEIYSKDINVLTDVKGDQVYLSNKELEYSTYIGKGAERIEVSEEFSIPSVDKVLVITPKVCLDRVETHENYLVVSGTVDIDACCQSSADNNLINHNHIFEFTQEVALDGIVDTSAIHSLTSILYNEIKVSSTIEDGGILVNVFVPLIYTAYVFNRNSMTIVDDLYSAQNYLSITSENFDTLNETQAIKFRDNVSGSASILETSPFIDDILGVCTNNIVLASSNITNDKLFVEGVANVTVVYFTKENSAVTAVDVQMPFSVEEMVDGKYAFVVTLCLKNVSARSKRGKEIEVSGELNVYADISSTKEECVISNLVIGEEKPKDNCSLYVYIVKPNQDIWSVAKEMNVSEDLILEQNEGVELPLKGGEKLVIYKPNVFGFDN